MTVLERETRLDTHDIERDLERITSDEEKLAYLTRVYLQGSIDMDQYQDRIDRLETQLDFRKLAERRTRRLLQGLRESVRFSE